MNKEQLEQKLREIHGNDEEQIEFILSDEKKIIVTAPAGCGKTKTMISKIAYKLVTTPNLNFKKVLALTFSVNAATKIKEDTARILPQLIERENYDLDKKLDVSNYHSFATKLINNHGYIIHENLKGVDGFTIVSDNVQLLTKYLTATEIDKINELSKAVNELDYDKVNNLQEDYFNILVNKLIPNNVVTYDGLLILANRLLSVENIRNFYKKFYPIVIIDEFQDTNYLAYKLITHIIDKNDNNTVILMGDDIQKIYGFLGAIPNIFNHMRSTYNMTSMEFKTNYRFKDNEKMKKLDFYLREIFRNYDSIEKFRESAEINFGFYTTRNDEAKKIVDCMVGNVKDGNNVALLVRGKKNANNVISHLEARGISYFNGLFSDIDLPYKKFHRVALDIFLRESGSSKSISKKVLDKVVTEVKAQQSKITDDNIMFNSLIRLLEALFSNVKTLDIKRIEKYNKIIFILGNNSLKRLMNEIDENIVLTTVHGAKGLEWDYVYIPEVMESKFPNYFGLCRDCKDSDSAIKYDNACQFKFLNHLKTNFEEELSLFYVAITRARKDVFIFANTEKQNNFPQKRSCFTMLPNLSFNREDEI
ncbi:MAG: ATP-dependent helicase UvrD/PcrA [Candidatus Petromonas sp.]|jgi:DNA helicase-2/ATP-dependent DNA helicase PcrA|nr:ATP-dependent helicase UvrD/PcrA [Candidatus Petromonas sp.]